MSLLLLSCSSYDKLLKSNNNELKLEEARKYYAQKKWLKTITLLDAVASHFKGTPYSEEVLYLTAKSYLGNKDYYSAASYFKTYTRTFPKGGNVEEAWFQIGYCHYKESPDARLDQTETVNAINAFIEYLQLYPNSARVQEANQYITELQEKLAYKAYLSVKLYYDLGNYLGNNYLSAVVTAQNIIKEYPNTKYKEELSFLILKAKFEQAEQSVPQKKEQRYRDTIDEYHNFVNEYPNGKDRKEADKIYKTSNDFVKE